MPTPRNLDPKFKDEKNMAVDEPVTESVDSTDETPETAEEKNGTQIVYRQQVQQGDGTVKEIQHGPMDRDEWPAYEKEHGL